jgi:ferric-dicitrate binding protein FerR (iron transport regulator)
MIDKEKFAALVKKYLEGKATAEEKEFLDAYYDEFHTGRSVGSVLNESQIRDLEVTMFNNIQARVRCSQEKQMGTWKRYKRRLAVAASLLVLVLCGFLWRHLSTRPGKGEDTLEISYVPAGSVKKLLLSDGTVVWLNARSTLRYPDTFGGKQQREVYLEGEAYFDIKKDEAHPFLVHTPGLTTHVLGTQFNVKAYQPRKAEVTLIEGKVMLTTAGIAVGNGTTKADTLVLAPNEKAVFTAGQLLAKETSTPAQQPVNAMKDDIVKTAALSKQVVLNAIASAAWRNGELIFDREPLENVLEALNRKRDISIKAAPELMNCPVSIKINNEPIEDILITITRQIKRKKTTGQPYNATAQYKKQGSDYYIE